MVFILKVEFETQRRCLDYGDVGKYKPNVAAQRLNLAFGV